MCLYLKFFFSYTFKSCMKKHGKMLLNQDGLCYDQQNNLKRGTVWKREWFVYVRHFGNCVAWQIHLLLVCKNRLISGYFLWNNLIDLSIVRNLWLLKIDEDFIYFYFELVVKRTCISSKLKLNISIHRSS